MSQLDRIELKVDFVLELLPIVVQFAASDTTTQRREANHKYRKVVQKYNEKYENLNNSTSKQDTIS